MAAHRQPHHVLLGGADAGAAQPKPGRWRKRHNHSNVRQRLRSAAAVQSGSLHRDFRPNAGQTGTGVTDASGNATFSYSSAVSGTDTVEAFVTTIGGTFTSNDVAVNWDQPITASPASISGVEGTSTGSQTVATFTDPDLTAASGDYSATIDWGDSSTSSGVISGSNGSFTVSGTHTYAEEGSYPVKVTIADNDDASNTAVANSTATVNDASLTPTCTVPAGTLQSFSGSTATFADGASPSGTLFDFSAMINWGDGHAPPEPSAGLTAARTR